MKLIQKLFLVVIFSSIFIISAKAQYDTDVVEPKYEDGVEVFGISTSGEKKLTFYPEGCNSIEKVVIELKSAVDGKIRVISYNDKTPVADKTVDKVYEYCEFKYENISKDDIKSLDIDLKVRKSWLQSSDVKESNIGLYIYDNEWKYQDTTKEKDNSIYYYYNSKPSYSQYFAVAEHKGGVNLPFNVSPWVVFICCVFLLFILLLLSIVYSISGRNKRKGGGTY